MLKHKFKDIDKKLKKYENSIYNNDYKSAFVIQENGYAYRFIGESELVSIVDMILKIL